MVPELRVIVTGSRKWTNAGAMEFALIDATAGADPKEPFTVVHGACPTGADAIADDLATRLGVIVERHPADWAAHGRKAGPIRNAEMIKAGADLVLAFPLPGGRGTQHAIRLAREAGIPVKVWGSE